MLQKTKLDIKCTLNFFMSFGINERGEFKIDRYNLPININTTDKTITAFITALETLTGFYCTGYEANKEKQKHIDNHTRAILTLRDPTPATPPVTMALRFSPVSKSDDNIQAVKKSFSELIGLVSK